AAQRGALDKFAGDSLAGPLATYQALYSHWKASQAELETLRSAARDRIREAESLEAALTEITNVDPQPGEDESLKAEAVKLANVEELRIAANTAHQALIAEDYGDAGDATTLVDAAKRTLEHVAEHDAELGSAAARLAEVGFLLNDIATELASYQAGLDSEGPERLAEIEDRRAALATLVRKYAPSIDEVLVWAENARGRFDELQDDSTRIEALDADVVRTEAELLKQAAAVSKIRGKAAKALSSRVSSELKALAMADATLVITLEAAGQLTPHGADEIAFLLQPHSGAPARPLGKGASGGELSRVMLAIEVVLAAVDPVPTFVFDEVDAGVGGRAAVEIGRRLAMLARHVQVLVVTHLPQVAAFADQHITVTKTSVRGADGGTATGFTSSDVRLLDGPERVRELARMLAGQEDSESAQAHAQELLDDAKLLPQRA
ncbi:MAG TPA: DNA repair protein RecN, partial [Arthrobacter bacterium]|nr:DNA repair protein RecN [Arthrobacter sp.]